MTQLPRILGGRYEVRQLIGRGGMADVYVGFDSRLNRTVAIKVLRADLARDPMFQNRFRREAQSAGRLNHPAIVAVYDTGEEATRFADGATGTVPYIIMEYVEGHTVRELLSEGDPVPIPEAVEIVAGILNALEYSHREGIVHRDIKPGNVMLTTDGKIKVMDFGIARAIEDSQSSMTQTHGVVGTAQYLSPEQARGEIVDSRSDLYSTGCVLFELLTGRPPFSGDTAVSVAYQHVQELPKPPSSIAADIPGSLDRVVLKSLAKNRDERYPDAATMRQDMLAAERGGAISAPPISSWAERAGDQTAVLGSSAVTGNTSQFPQVSPPLGTTALMGSGPAPAPAPPAAVAAPTQTEPKKPVWPWIVGVLAFLLAGLGLAYALSGGEEQEEAPALVEVPNLKDLDQQGARTALEKADLQFELGPEVQSDTVERGRFVSSDPTAGASVPPKTKVKVSFSAGAETISVPDVRGQDEETARRKLEEAKLTVGTVAEEASNDVPEGQVVRTSPEAGTSVKSGEKINLFLSSGPGELELPDMRGWDSTRARQELERLGLKVGAISSADTGEFGRDELVSTAPEPGSTVKKGDTVDIVISTGLTEIQDFTGRQLAEAQEFFAKNGLNLEITTIQTNDRPDGTVLTQNPTAGKFDRGQTIKISVARPLAQQPTPEPSASTTPAATDDD
ncbi:Stk1 family PASTA domain-containing Ser/Thr kinase [Buchananella hordeovulneris]|uniref:Stk1 family PASTA domain-containing Ser/Thr kinase n=1 Tax=Buchananella hordeovulneris TaxID=52770 RepID=UPI000F5FC8E9|nr:Stk1 family PASTA domain-containing Ser/Thr kinase [Buchananella hordeovulneris]MDO5081443.1 Stk1 family PASTA domain-containing Ser/Thr kinase [Buchananella hordeovulneris]RRD42437.1 Stk1 family PASTA domain-containing Ser/Thr kinase [Buchananella hordeovulneris]RRD49432.1 Stk1 family PASTA domain-containing Ser/Thr kinase [Buchananella hordeovulneris]